MKRIRRPSPALLVAFLALFVALGSGTYAAVKLGKNAVKTKNIKNGAVTESKLAGNAVTEGKIANGAVTNAKLAPDAKSTAGITTLTTRIVSASLGPTGTFAGVDLTAPCQAGEIATGGGGLINNDDNEVTYQASHPSPNTNGTTPTGWTVRFQITGIAHTVTTYAVCAK